MKLVLHQFELPLRHVFTISRESISVQPTLICELRHEGQRGFGEATTNAYYGATIDRMADQLNALRSQIENHTATKPEELWERVSPSLANDPFALCALDQAANDLAGKLMGRRVFELWGYAFDQVPDSNFTIGIDDIDVMVQKLKETPEWPVYKIKLGTAHDLEIVEELRRHTNARFRVDANCGWTVEETIANSNRLRDLGVEFIEQPLPADDWDGHRAVYNGSSLPIMADESCITPDDVRRCAGHFHGVNIKLVKCGGLTPARRMILDAKERGLKTMVGCMTESTVGISAISQLLPLLDYVDMDGAALLSRDIATGVTVDHGKCRLAKDKGTGAQLIEDNPILPH